MSLPDADPRLKQAVDLFNAREFFACHDVLEEIWSETLADDRTFYQGLIHAAVALHHFEEGNPGGARKMYFSATRYLAPYAPEHDGIAVERLLADLLSCFDGLRTATAETVNHIRLVEQRIPKLHWTAPPPDASLKP